MARPMPHLTPFKDATPCLKFRNSMVRLRRNTVLLCDLYLQISAFWNRIFARHSRACVPIPLSIFTVCDGRSMGLWYSTYAVHFAKGKACQSLSSCALHSNVHLWKSVVVPCALFTPLAILYSTPLTTAPF